MSRPRGTKAGAKARRAVPALQKPPAEPGVTELPPPPSQGVTALADQVRKWGMYLLLWAFVGTAGLSLATVVFLNVPDAETVLRLSGKEERELAVALADRPFDHLKQILQILLPAETALLGSAMGFYYGSKTKSPGE